MKPKRLRTPELDGSEASWALLLFVGVALVALVVVPILGDRYVGSMQAELREVAEPARRFVTDIQFQLAAGGAAARDLVETGDQVFLQRYQQAVNQERIAYQKLEPLLAQLGASAVSRYAELRQQEARWDAHLASLVERGPIRPDAAERNKELDLYDQTILAAARLDQAITEFAEQTRVRITRAERTVLTLTIGLVALAALAALVVAHLGRRLRRYARTAEQRRAALEDVLQSKARLMSGITHDLKNPLNA